MNKNYIYGAGGHGKVVSDAMRKAQIECSGFIDDKPMSTWFGLHVHQLNHIVNEVEADDFNLHLAIGNCKVREVIASKMHHVSFFSVMHPSSVVATTASIGVGSFVAAQSVVAPDVKVGKHCIINHGAIVDHDCLVGDFSHIAPSSNLGGGVRVGKGVLIGSGAVILPGINIADYAVIGAGAVVTKSISNCVIVVGNPARIIHQ